MSFLLTICIFKGFKIARNCCGFSGDKKSNYLCIDLNGHAVSPDIFLVPLIQRVVNLDFTVQFAGKGKQLCR